MRKLNPKMEAGMRFGRLVALRFERKDGSRAHWRFLCDCKNEKVIAIGNVYNGITSSCGCLHRELVSKRFTTHGDSQNRRMTPEHRAWSEIKRRCFNTKTSSYKRYGGRGITMHPEWIDSYEAFLSYMGRRPSKNHSIDRFPDVNGNYEPGNVRWATTKEQANNKGNSKKLTFNGETHTEMEWAAILKMPRTTIQQRLRRGWSVDQALGTKTLKSWNPHIKNNVP